MISDKLLNALNDQINFEYYSAYQYIAMAAYCDAQDLKGFSNFFKVQKLEEEFHASKFYSFINDRDGEVILKGMPDPMVKFSSVSDAFIKALKHENIVTSKIYNLMDIAMDEREHATISFLKWFVDEQVEEEANFTTIIKRLERIGNDTNALYVLDAELALRVFTPPVVQ